MYAPDGDRAAKWQEIVRLAADYGASLEGPMRSHLSLDLGPFRLRFEPHSEFARY